MHSIFYCTPLELLLNELEVKTLILCGLAGNICFLFSANDAHMRNYELIVPSDCIASNSRKDNDFAQNQMKHILGAKIGTAIELGSLLKQAEENNRDRDLD